MKTLASIALLGLIPALVLGQAPVDENEQVANLAVNAVINRDSDGPRLADRGRVKVDLEVINSRAIDFDLGQGRRLERAKRNETLDCPTGRANSCSLLGTDFLVTVKRVVVTAADAEVEVEVMGEYPSDRQPVWTALYGVSLRQTGDEWGVINVRTIGSS